jgi:hypothetical protein
MNERKEGPMTIVADFTSEYSLRAALRQARFSECAIAHAMTALFPIVEDNQDDTPFEPTAEDWDDYRAWAAEVDARWCALEQAEEDYAEAMALADIYDHLERERGYSDYDLQAAGLPPG